ncbi:MAG: 4Fe-4S dicluster domain-containing protein [Eubacteriales bacterium]
MKSVQVEKKILKAILWIYIVMCIVIAGLNYGYAPKADVKASQFITGLWHFYENWVKTLFILVGGFLTIRITRKNQPTRLRQRNLIGFLVAALIVHITLPLVSGNHEWYFFTMPLPWTTTPLQLLDTNSAFYLSRFPMWGSAGIASVLVFYGIVTLLIFIGTLLFGRRMQCSMLCLFNGFAAEVFDPAIPLIGKKRKPGKKQLGALTIARWMFLSLALIFTLFWVLSLLGYTKANVQGALAKTETYIYLSGELLMAMFFWVAFIGRGYCYYCPLGTVLSGLARLGGQRIDTTLTECIGCGKCTTICPMTIDVKAAAQAKMPLKAYRCVGCGRCIDVCPTHTLHYTTGFLSKVSKKAKKS